MKLTKQGRKFLDSFESKGMTSYDLERLNKAEEKRQRKQEKKKK